MTRDRAPRCLDLARCNSAGVGRFEPEGAEIKGGPTFGETVNAAFVGFAILLRFGLSMA